MAKIDGNFEETVKSLFQGMTGFMSTKTVVGEAVNIGDTIILPLVDVSFGMGAGTKSDGGAGKDKASSAGGLGGKVSPSAVLVIKDGACRLVNIKNQDTITKIIDMVPDIVDRFQAKKSGKKDEIPTDEIIDAAKKSVSE